MKSLRVLLATLALLEAPGLSAYAQVARVVPVRALPAAGLPAQTRLPGAGLLNTPTLTPAPGLASPHPTLLPAPAAPAPAARPAQAAVSVAPAAAVAPARAAALDAFFAGAKARAFNENAVTPSGEGPGRARFLQRSAAVLAAPAPATPAPAAAQDKPDAKALTGLFLARTVSIASFILTSIAYPFLAVPVVG